MRRVVYIILIIWKLRVNIPGESIWDGTVTGFLTTGMDRETPPSREIDILKQMGCVPSNPHDPVGYAKQLPDLMITSFCRLLQLLRLPNSFQPVSALSKRGTPTPLQGAGGFFC